MPSRHVTTMYLFFSEEQLNIVIAAAVLSVSFLGVSTMLSYPWKIAPILMILGVWVMFFKYARTREVLRRSKALYKYHMRRLRGYTTIEKYNNKTQNNVMAGSLYPVRQILKNGLIDFGNNKYGYLILCTPRKTTDDEAAQQIENIQKFLNSFNHKVIFKISARSQIPVSNAVQDMTARKINNKRLPRRRPCSIPSTT